MKRNSFWLIASFTALIGLATSANAALNVVPIPPVAPGGGASIAGGTFYENFDSLTPILSGPQTINLSGGLDLKLDVPASQVVSGTTSAYAAPFLSGLNGNHFGNPNPTFNQPIGQDTTTYVTAGGGATVTFQFAALQSYFGLLWGSVDTYNTLSFYSGNTLIGSFTGSYVKSVANGSQNSDGTIYINFQADDSGSQFDKVVASSSQNAFEIDNVAFSQNSFSDPIVPEPASLVVWSVLGIAGFVAYRRRRAA